MSSPAPDHPNTTQREPAHEALLREALTAFAEGELPTEAALRDVLAQSWSAQGITLPAAEAQRMVRKVMAGLKFGRLATECCSAEMSRYNHQTQLWAEIKGGAVNRVALDIFKQNLKFHRTRSVVESAALKRANQQMQSYLVHPFGHFDLPKLRFCDGSHMATLEQPNVDANDRRVTLDDNELAELD